MLIRINISTNEIKWINWEGLKDLIRVQLLSIFGGYNLISAVQVKHYGNVQLTLYANII